MEPHNAEEPAKELERLAEEQMNDLESDSVERHRRARQRRERVLAIHSAGNLQTSADRYYAALILLYGDEVAHFDLAHQLARHAARDGDGRAWSVVAAAWDRALIARGQPQHFGTQFIRDQGRWALGSVNERTTDAERAFYGVPPLWVQRQQLEQIQQREAEDES